jgi:hypothetical protein
MRPVGDVTTPRIRTRTFEGSARAAAMLMTSPLGEGEAVGVGLGEDDVVGDADAELDGVADGDGVGSGAPVTARMSLGSRGWTW